MDDSFSVAELLTEEQRLDYFYGVMWQLLSNRTSDLLDLIEKLPSAELQTGVVERLVKNWTLEDYFNAEQIRTLKSYMSE